MVVAAEDVPQPQLKKTLNAHCEGHRIGDVQLGLAGFAGKSKLAIATRPGDARQCMQVPAQLLEGVVAQRQHGYRQPADPIGHQRDALFAQCGGRELNRRDSAGFARVRHPQTLG